MHANKGSDSALALRSLRKGASGTVVEADTLPSLDDLHFGPATKAAILGANAWDVEVWEFGLRLFRASLEHSAAAASAAKRLTLAGHSPHLHPPPQQQCGGASDIAAAELV